MIICEQISGNLKDRNIPEKDIDHVEIEWHEAYKRIHSKVSTKGREVGIRLGDFILTRGLRDGDILCEEDDYVLAVSIVPCEVIDITVEPDNQKMACKVCYEIGNRHGALLWGRNELNFITPYNEPVYAMLEKMHGISLKRDTIKLDFDRAISSTVSDHHH